MPVSAVLLSLIAAAALAAFQDVPANGSGKLEASTLASSVLSGMEIAPEICPGALRRNLDGDRSAVCGTGPSDREQVEARLRRALVSPNHYRYTPIRVRSWRGGRHGWQRTAYWLGDTSLEVMTQQGGSRVAVVASRPYPRCGNGVPILPRTGSSAGVEIAPPLLVPAEDYPDRAAREKIDGAVNLALLLTKEGDARIVCIHHATPSGYGFELPAIETARLISTTRTPRERDTIVSVVVQFSKAGERGRRPQRPRLRTDGGRLVAEGLPAAAHPPRR